MTRMLVNWLVSAVVLLVVARVVPGFHVSGLVAALIAAVVIGLVNATLGAVLKLLTFPITVLTLGVFWFVINALMLKLAAALVTGFDIDGFLPALVGAVLLSLINMIIRRAMPEPERD